MRSTCCLLGALLLSSSLGAQDSVRVVPPGTSLRLRVADRDLIYGRAVSSTDSSLTLRTLSGLETVAYGAIQQTELRRGSAGHFAAIGGLIGASLGVAASIIFKDVGCQYEGCEHDAQIGAGVIFGGVPSAIIGAFIGAMTPRWQHESLRVAVLEPAQSVPVHAALPTNECGPGINGSLNIGVTRWASPAAEGSVVINCQPARTLSLSGAVVSLPRRSGRTDYYGYTNVTDAMLSRGSITAERFLVGHVRGSFSITYNIETSARPTERAFGFGGGLSAARRLRGQRALRTALNAYARPNSDRKPEITFFLGLERMARETATR